MKASWRRLAAALLAAWLLALGGCAARAPASAAPPFNEVVIIPVVSPESIYTQNRMFAVPIVPALIASSIANRAKSKDFSERMDQARAQLGPRFTAILQQELQSRGIRTRILDLPAGAEPVESLDDKRLPSEGGLLWVGFSDVSMDSPRTLSYYLPRVNVDVEFTPRRDARDNHTTSLSYYYGTDADGTEPWSIPSAEKYRYPDFDTLMARADEVRESWDQAMREMARRIASALPPQQRGG